MRSDDLDRMIDSALREINEVDIPSGIESRVLNRVRFGKPPRTRITIWWPMMVGVAAAAMVFAFYVARPVPLSPLSVTAWVPSPRLLPLRPFVSPVTSPRQIHRGRSLGRNVSASRLSPQELALVELATRYPAEATDALASLHQKQTVPVEIAPLSIAPIEIENLSEENIK